MVGWKALVNWALGREEGLDLFWGSPRIGGLGRKEHSGQNLVRPWMAPGLKRVLIREEGPKRLFNLVSRQKLFLGGFHGDLGERKLLF